MLKYYGLTDIGKRKNNEDSYETLALKHKSTSENLHLLAVADGLGGHSAGEVASRLSIIELFETVKRGIDAYDAITSGSMKELLTKGFKKANEEIILQAEIVPERSNMGTTLVAALLKDAGFGVVANLGDSRAYLVSQKGIVRITKDHSYVQELLDNEVISEEEAFDHPEKNIVTKIIGKKDDEPDLFEVDISDGMLLLCSDGLSDALRDEEIKEIVIRSSEEDLCGKLVEEAKVNGHDNITVIAASIR
ncbi:MAG: protein phosphatase 2C domain-containing protein [Halobacteriota archaeon]|nr:protein phosphatase 2C domain-containing protein [Halobacteriota archaeon]